MARARFYDGRQARPQDVVIIARTMDLHILDAPGGKTLSIWPWTDIAVLDPPHGGTPGMLSHKGEPECRLVIAGDLWPEVAPYLVAPKANFFTPGSLVVLCVMSVAFVAALLFFSPQILDAASRYIPYSWEEQLGDAALGSFTGGKFCKGSPVAQKALARLAMQLDEEGNSFDVQVTDEDMVNALTFPARHIVIFSGLLKLTEKPDELAGVLAHEVGHAHHRHPIRLFAQSAGVQLLLGMALGDATAVSQATGVARQLLMMKGGRDFEREADAYAVTAMLRNNFDPAGLAQFLTKMEKEHPDKFIPEWMNSHPMTGNRVETLKKSIAAQKKKTEKIPPMTAAEWKAVRSYCGDK